MRSAAVPFGWIIGCPLLGFVSDRHRPAQAGDRRRRLVLLACLAWILYGRPDVLPPYVARPRRGHRLGRRDAALHGDQGSQPARVSGTATGVINFLNFTFSALLGPVFGGPAGARRRRRREPMTLEHYQAAFSRCSTAWRSPSFSRSCSRRPGRPWPTRRLRYWRRPSHDSRPGTGKYERLLERCQGLAPVPTAVAYPCEETALAGALEAGAAGLIMPILVGPAAKIARSRARRASISATTYASWTRPHSRAAAAKAVELVRMGEAELLMKGSLHTDEMLGAVVAQETRPAHRPAPQPRVPHGRADLSQGADRHRRRDQHRADARGQGRHLPERHRSRASPSASSGRRWRSSPRSRR